MTVPGPTAVVFRVVRADGIVVERIARSKHNGATWECASSGCTAVCALDAILLGVAHHGIPAVEVRGPGEHTKAEALAEVEQTYESVTRVLAATMEPSVARALGRLVQPRDPVVRLVQPRIPADPTDPDAERPDRAALGEVERLRGMLRDAAQAAIEALDGPAGPTGDETADLVSRVHVNAVAVDLPTHIARLAELGRTGWDCLDLALHRAQMAEGELANWRSLEDTDGQWLVECRGCASGCDAHSHEVSSYETKHGDTAWARRVNGVGHGADTGDAHFAASYRLAVVLVAAANGWQIGRILSPRQREAVRGGR